MRLLLLALVFVLSYTRDKFEGPGDSLAHGPEFRVGEELETKSEEPCIDYLVVTTNSPGHLSENGEYFGFDNDCADTFFGTTEWGGRKYEVVVNGYLERVLVFRDGNTCEQSCGRISPVISDHVYNFKNDDIIYHAKLAEPCPANYVQIGKLDRDNNIVGEDLGVSKVATIAECQFKCEELSGHQCKAFMFGSGDLKYKHGHSCKLSSSGVPTTQFGKNFRFCQRKLPCSKALRVVNAYPGELGQKGEYFGFNDLCANTFFGTHDWKNQKWHIRVGNRERKILTFKEGPHCRQSCGRITPFDEHQANDWKLGDLIFHAEGYSNEQPSQPSGAALAASFEESASQFTNFAMIIVLSGAAFGMGYYLSKFRAKSGLVTDYQNME